MRLGLDFDHTLISYDALIAAAALARGLIRPQDGLRTKREIRDAIRGLPDGDLRWQEIQSYIYAEGVPHAAPAADLETLFDFVRNHRIETWIVSHKTSTAPFDPLQRNLREAALTWMEQHGFFDPAQFGLARERVIFADTKEQKLAAIGRLNLTVFVDDLPEILTHPDFPTTPQKILYAPESGAPTSAGGERSLHRAASWRQITDSLSATLSEEKLADTATRRIGAEFSSAPVAGGRNSRCFRVAAVGRDPVFLKQYFRSTTDPRNRLATEYQALDFLWAAGIRHVPPPLFCDDATHSAGYGFVAGTPAAQSEVAPADIDRLLDFLAQLHGLRARPGAGEFAAASEAFFSARDLAENLRRRRRRLAGVTDARVAEFLATLDPAVDETLAHLREELALRGLGWEEELAPAGRTLSPSDIGFHNALRTAGGELVFIDFEYFGWDDPAKLICDFLLQPEQRLSAECRQRFREGALAIYGDPLLAWRQETYLPLFRLKWVMILLNEFLRHDGARRAFACPGAGATAAEGAHAQLEKARRMAEPLLQPATAGH